jgi:hypothetical protein
MRVSTLEDGLAEYYSMAGDARYDYRGVDGCISEKIQKELGILALSFEQCVVDHLGLR